MKLLTYRKNKEVQIGIVNKKGDRVIALKEFGITYPSMNALIENMNHELKWKLECISNGGGGCLIDEIEFLAPIPNPKQDIICLGLNYMEHAKESAKYSMKDFGGDRCHPVYFSKRISEAVPHGGYIERHIDFVDHLDYEVELAVIIGRKCRNVSIDDAKNFIFGYTILNDVSGRDIQTSYKQWYFGKSLDGFTPIGPYIVTADEFVFPPKLTIQSYVNGELRQNANTSQLIFGISHIISELSKGMTLEAGTIIATGTPSGAGMGFDPPKFLKIGDKVECRIEGIGSLVNEVR